MSSTTKVWFVTGTPTGLGRAVTEHALRQGDFIVAALHKPESLSDLLLKYSSQLLVFSSDVKNPEQIHMAFENALERFGRVDIVLNNAETQIIPGEAEGMSDEHGRELFEVLFWGAMNVTKEAVRTFRERNDPPGGRLLQMSCQAASKAPPGVAHYAAAKAALECLSEGLASELDPSWNIKISIIQWPAFFQTNPASLDVASPVHPSYSDPDLPSRGAPNELSAYRLDGGPEKFAQMVYRLASMDDPPFYLPLHREAIQAVKARGESLIRAAEEYGSWSDDVYFNQD